MQETSISNSLGAYLWASAASSPAASSSYVIGQLQQLPAAPIYVTGLLRQPPAAACLDH